ncbi:DUF7289 family protein [Salinibaculum rarum]|uniref:DUF7289 family protein n=1 Tax=Salinibaculum rarum TaxID=3058903 RepID=UPI00265F0A38|nr:hypothetical protein [Salinibaculum sp. KK48]
MDAFTNETRGQSSSIGVILITAVVILGLTAIGYFGHAGFQDSTSEVSTKAAENELERVSGGVNKVTQSNAPETVVDLRTDRIRNGGNIVVRGDRGNINVTVMNSTGQHTILNRSLGVVEYRDQKNRVGYQGGGVFANYEDQSMTVVSDPAMSPKTLRGSTSVNFPILIIEGRANLLHSVRITKNNTRSEEKLYGSLWIPADGGLRVEIQSEYAQAWSTYFNETFDTGAAEVTYTASTNTVVLEYYTDDTVGAGEDTGFYLHMSKFVVDVTDR